MPVVKTTQTYVTTGNYTKLGDVVESAHSSVVKDTRPRGVWIERRKLVRFISVKHKQVYHVNYLVERLRKERVKQYATFVRNGKVVRKKTSTQIVYRKVYKRKSKKVTSVYTSRVPYVSSTDKAHYDLSMPRSYSADFAGWELEKPGTVTACRGLSSYIGGLQSYTGHVADVMSLFGYDFVGQNIDPLSRIVERLGGGIKPSPGSVDDLWSQALATAQSELVSSARQFDLGTTLGEAKESFAMFRDIVLDIVQVLKRIRNGSIAKEALYLRRPKAPDVDQHGITHSFQAWLSNGGDPKEWLKSAAKDVVNGKGEAVADAAAQAWLLSRYGLQPLASSLVDAYTALSVGRFAPLSRFTGKGSASDKNTDVLYNLDAYAHCGFRLQVLQESETIVKCKLGGDMEAKFSEAFRLGTLNPIGIAWELVPLSFVADWFLAIGDALQQLDIEAAFNPVYWSKTTVVRGGTVVKVSFGNPVLFKDRLWDTYAFTSVNVPKIFCEWENNNPEQRTPAGYRWIYEQLQAQCNSEPSRVFYRRYGGGSMRREAHFSTTGSPVGYFPTQGIQLGSMLNFKRSLDLAALFKQIVF